MDSPFIFTEEVAFLSALVGSIVSKPEEVKVELSNDDRGVLLTLTVDIEDMGKVIGKQGEMANSIRKILRAFGAKKNKKISVKIID